MPKRDKGEKLSDFLARFVRTKHEKRKVPELKQRLESAYSEASEKRHAR